MGVIQNTVKTIPLTVFDMSTLTASFQAINGNGFEFPLFFIRFENASTADVTISYDGVTPHEFLAGTAASIPRQILEINFLTSFPSQGYIAFAKDTKVFVRGTAGTGNLYLSGYYLPTRGN